MQNQLGEGRQKMVHWEKEDKGWSIYDYQWQNHFWLNQLFGFFVIWFDQEVFETEYMWNCWMKIPTTIGNLIPFAKLAKKYLVCRAVHVSMMGLMFSNYPNICLQWSLCRKLCNTGYLVVGRNCGYCAVSVGIGCWVVRIRWLGSW